MINRPGVYVSACAAAIAFTSASAMAIAHQWKINELFSNADGTIQFIELKECCGWNNEYLLYDKYITTNAHNTPGTRFNFPGNLCLYCTANKHLLLATTGFAALPGAPTPDYTISDGFFSVSGDTITYYFGPPTYDARTFGALDLPTDGINSLNYPGATAAANSPTNFAGQTASLNLPCLVADMGGNGAVDVPDLLTLLAAWGTNPGGPPDLDGDGIVAVPDLLILLANWGPC